MFIMNKMKMEIGNFAIDIPPISIPSPRHRVIEASKRDRMDRKLPPVMMV